MEDSVVAAYIALLLGCILQDNEVRTGPQLLIKGIIILKIKIIVFCTSIPTLQIV